MAFKFTPNLSTTNVQDCIPWEMGLTHPQVANKEAFKAWSQNPATEHAFVTGMIGQTPTQRLGQGNHVMHMTGLVLDYDAVPPSDPATLLLNAAPAHLRPAWVSRTYSGHCRVYYVFEHTIPVFATDIAKDFLKKVARELKLRKLLAGFEMEAFLDISKQYEVGINFEPVGDGLAVIPAALLTAWVADVYKKHKWEKEGITIEIEALRKQGSEKFPGKWPGGWENFDFNVRGPRFWDESASDPTAVIVRESGIQYFSDGGGFYRWENVPGFGGPDFVRQFSDTKRGLAISGTYYDGTNYWQKLPTGQWASSARCDILLDLSVDKRLNTRSVGPNTPSDADAALHAIQKLNRVQQAMPFLYKPDGIYYYNGARFLNNSTVRPIMPHEDFNAEGANFPWLSQFLNSFFNPADQLDFFLAWLKHFYMGAVTQEPTRGLAMFIAGPVSSGKTVLNKAILGQLMGGRQDAGKFLLGQDQFNSSLFTAALWNVDDAVTSDDRRQRSQFTQMVKQIVANDSFTYRAMYQAGADLEWIGRIIVTMNNDPDSMQMLPETDRNIEDKVMLLQAKVPEVIDNYWPSNLEIAAELPYLGSFLRDWQPPAHCVPTNPRFGVRPYQHDGLLHAARGASTTSIFEEVVQLWRKEYFAVGGPGATEPSWTGNATAFHQVLASNESLRPVLDRSFTNSTALGMHLRKLVRLGTPWITHFELQRTYAIHRP